MVDTSAIGAALTSLKAAKDIAEAMVGLRDTAAFQGKLIEFQSKIIDANEAAFAAQDERASLLQRISELEEKVAQFEAWEAEKQRYKLQEVASGRFVYALKESVQASEPHHKLCTRCFDQGIKSIMQENHWARGRTVTLNCPNCSADLVVKGLRQDTG